MPLVKPIEMISNDIDKLANSTENREEFNKEYNELINIEHDLETEKLNFPKKIEDGFSSIDLNILETFFDLSGLEETLTEKEE